MTDGRLRELVASAQWFHAIDFGGGLVSPGRFGERLPPNYTLFGVLELLHHIDLRGASVVDVGTMDGLVAFVMARLGAARVVATDLAERETFTAARAALDLQVDYRVPVQASALPELLAADRADLIVMAGVLYHVFDPLTVLEASRRALKRDGFLIVETSYLFDEGGARMSFSPADRSARGIDRANVFWRPSRRALEGMLRLVGFEVVATIAVDGRLTVLAQAKRPDDIADRSPRIRTFHQRYMRYANYKERIDLDALVTDASLASTLSYQGRRGYWRLYPALYQARVPLQPAWQAPRGADRYSKVIRSAWFHVRSTLGDLLAWRDDD